MKKFVCSFVLLSFSWGCLQLPAIAQESVLPQPGVLVAPRAAGAPACLKGMFVNRKNPFEFSFILDPGHSGLSGNALKEESNKLIRYFLAALTIPQKDLWVNLSPYEKDRVIDDQFEKTEMGGLFLNQDYLLKQLASSLTSPEGNLGKKFWRRIYEEALKKYGTTDVPVDVFNKIWIVPDKAVVYEHGNAVVVLEQHLKVMVEEDYLAVRKARDGEAAAPASTVDASHGLSAGLLREIVVPEVEREVNEGMSFAPLRQVFQSMVLAVWYKNKFERSSLNKSYADKKLVNGIDLSDKALKQTVFDRYLRSVREGVYNVIREEKITGEEAPLPRKYFSGGVDGSQMTVTVVDKTVKSQIDSAENRSYLGVGGSFSSIDAAAAAASEHLSSPETSPKAIAGFERFIKSLNSSPDFFRQKAFFQNPAHASLMIASKLGVGDECRDLIKAVYAEYAGNSKALANVTWGVMHPSALIRIAERHLVALTKDEDPDSAVFIFRQLLTSLNATTGDKFDFFPYAETLRYYGLSPQPDQLFAREFNELFRLSRLHLGLPSHIKQRVIEAIRQRLAKLGAGVTTTGSHADVTLKKLSRDKDGMLREEKTAFLALIKSKHINVDSLSEAYLKAHYSFSDDFFIWYQDFVDKLLLNLRRTNQHKQFIPLLEQHLKSSAVQAPTAEDYLVLGLTEGALRGEVIAAFHKLSKSQHEDAGGANKSYPAVSAAYTNILRYLDAAQRPMAPPDKAAASVSELDLRVARQFFSEFERWRSGFLTKAGYLPAKQDVFAVVQDALAHYQSVLAPLHAEPTILGEAFKELNVPYRATDQTLVAKSFEQILKRRIREAQGVPEHPVYELEDLYGIILDGGRFFDEDPSIACDRYGFGDNFISVYEELLQTIRRGPAGEKQNDIILGVLGEKLQEYGVEQFDDFVNILRWISNDLTSQESLRDIDKTASYIAERYGYGKRCRDAIAGILREYESTLSALRKRQHAEATLHPQALLRIAERELARLNGEDTTGLVFQIEQLERSLEGGMLFLPGKMSVLFFGLVPDETFESWYDAFAKRVLRMGAGSEKPVLNEMLEQARRAEKPASAEVQMAKTRKEQIDATPVQRLASEQLNFLKMVESGTIPMADVNAKALKEEHHFSDPFISWFNGTVMEILNSHPTDNMQAMKIVLVRSLGQMKEEILNAEKERLVGMLESKKINHPVSADVLRRYSFSDYVIEWYVSTTPRIMASLGRFMSEAALVETLRSLLQKTVVLEEPTDFDYQTLGVRKEDVNDARNTGVDRDIEEKFKALKKMFYPGADRGDKEAIRKFTEVHDAYTRIKGRRLRVLGGQPGDSSMAPGGIDFSSDWLNIVYQGPGMEVDFSEVSMTDKPLSGLKPLIKEMVPLPNLDFLL